MPRFTFKLDGVLRLRRRAEKDAQRALAARLADAGRMEDELRQLNSGLVGATNELRDGRLTGPIDVAYLTAHRRYTADVARRGTAVMTRLAAAQRACDEARSALGEAVKQRRVLELLREKHEAQWKAERARREQVEADDATAGWLADADAEGVAA